MERVAFLIEETHQRLGCLLNPENLIMRRLAGVQPRRSTSGPVTGVGLSDDPLLYTGGGRTQLDLELLFDVSLAGSSLAVEDVRELTAPLWNLAENAERSSRYGRPPLVRFIWGKSWNIPGIVVAVAERLEDFTAEGVPRRSWLRMRMLRASEPAESAPPAGRGPAVGETLPPLALAIGQAPGRTLAVHRPVGGEPAGRIELPSIGGALFSGADMVAAAVAETPAGRALMRAQRDLAEAVEAMMARIAGWVAAVGDSAAVRAVREGLEGIARRAASVAEAAKTRLVETAVAASAAIAGAVEEVQRRIERAAGEVGQEIAEAMRPLLENVVPVARAMGEAALLVGRAVKARAARVVAAAATRIEWVADQIDAALERGVAAMGEAGTRAVDVLREGVSALRGALSEMVATGRAALSALPAALERIGEGVEGLWATGQKAAARAVEAGVRAASVAVQRIAAAAEAIRCVTRDRVLPAAHRAVDALRRALRGEPAAGEGAEQEETSLPAAGRAALFRQVEAVAGALGLALAGDASASLALVRSALEQPGEPGPEVLAALEAIEAAMDASAEADRSEGEGWVRAALSGARSQPEASVQESGMPLPASGEGEMRAHTRAGERLDQIAYRYYRDPAMWRLLAVANDIDHPFQLSPDRPLRIPPAPVGGVP